MLEKPSTKKILLLSIITLGLYFFYWASKSGAQVNAAAHQKLVPSAWLLIVPFGGYWWVWYYGLALETVSFRRIRGSDVFLVYLIATLVFSPYSSFRVMPDVSGHHLWQFILIFLGISLVIYGIIVSAVFCSVVQSKINKSVASRGPTA
ncbi:MAG: hypothetical protein JWN38_992 [Candidatus Saccharibacteria bacterium]|nr:hypothetical protein [Candidatus Saccharibacteria bacterium]